MNSAKIVSIIFALLSASVSHAAITYTCHLGVVDATNTDVIDQNFSADESGGSHGGDAQVFTSQDGLTKVAVSVDGKWILVNWSKSNKVIANAVFVVGNISQEPRVALLYNPEDSQDQVSVDCSPSTPL